MIIKISTMTTHVSYFSIRKLIKFSHRKVVVSSFHTFPSRLAIAKVCPTKRNVSSQSSDESDTLRKFWTIPNIITITRMASCPLITMAIISDMKEAAILGCVAGAFSDWLDGYIAKSYNQKVYKYGIGILISINMCW